MKIENCIHEWVEDELLASGAIMLFFGKADNLGQETKLVCKKCGEINYVEKTTTSK